jgi:hypothetical protein
VLQVDADAQKPQFRNTITNKQKRRNRLARLQQYQTAGVILYTDETCGLCEPDDAVYEAVV